MTVALLASWLYAAGCGPICASGIIANAEAEAGPAFDPSITSRSGVGLFQLAGAHRRRFLARYGARWNTVAAQVEYVMTSLPQGLRARLLSATSPSAAATMFMLEYERPRNRDPSRRARRAAEIHRELMSSAMVR